jgi:endonuclease YncB( thermonuclease family)
VHNQDVTVEWYKRDRYGRIVGKVWTSAGEDAAPRQLQVGMAWWYRKYAREQTPEDRTAYESHEADARAASLGLWQDGALIPPWEFRKR